MWTKKLLLFSACWIGIVCANERLHQQVLQDYIDRNGTIELGQVNRAWVFNDYVYVENSSGQWIPAGYKLPGNYDAWLNDLAARGVCPKEHRGVYLDKTIYECGIWYCRGVMHTGQQCPYHIDKQLPGGIPRKA